MIQLVFSQVKDQILKTYKDPKCILLHAWKFTLFYLDIVQI